MLFKRIFKSKKPVNNIGISSSKQSVQIPNIHEIALKRAFFVYYDDDNIIDNLEYFLYLGENIVKIINNLKINNATLDSYSKVMNICKIQDVFEFVDKYNKKFNINLDINKLINDGIIDFDSLEYEKMVSERRDECVELNGQCCSDGNSIIVKNYGSLSDAVTLIHELSHYKDIPDKSNETRFWFTEALAITEELIAVDELNDIDLKLFCFYFRLLYTKQCLRNLNGILPIMIVFQKIGDVSKESYKCIFKCDYYDEDIKVFLNYINYYLEKNKKFGLNTPVFEQLVMELKYVIGYIVAISLYKKYKLDNNYMNEIQNLHKLINELDVNDFIDRMNISTGVEDICEILKEYIYYLMKSILIIEKNGFLHIFHMYCVSGRDWFKKVSDMEHFFLMKRSLYFTLDFMMINSLQVELSNGLGMESGRKILLMQNLIMS